MAVINEATLPGRMRALPRDERGYPVPWFVAWMEGKPEFRASDGQKLAIALRQKRCWVCGHTLGVNVCFVVGPMCGINRISSEPPSHLDCARWSAENCPFLSNPRMARREDERVNNGRLREEAPGFAITRNPGVTMLWSTRSFEVFLDPKNRPLISMGSPEHVEWWACGRRATREEVLEAVESGWPILMAAAETQGAEAVGDLRKARQRFERNCLPEVVPV